MKKSSIWKMRLTLFMLMPVLPLGLAGCRDDTSNGSLPGSNAPAKSLAETSDIAATTMHAGATPFVSFVDLAGTNIAELAQVRYTIATRPGAISRPISISYTLNSLRRRGRVAGATITLPVAGLYAGFANSVAIDLVFSDNSIRTLTATIAAPVYDAVTPLNNPTKNMPQSTSSILGFSFFLMKPNSVKAPATIIDSDGYIRWVSKTLVDQAVLFRNGGIDIADSTTSSLYREELDNSTSTVTSSNSSIRSFHHDLSMGKSGILAQPNTTGRLEDYLIELLPDGTEIKSWDFANIFEEYMISFGDDPKGFVRRGIDWFHINSAIYDPRDDSIIASSRENFVVKLDYNSGAIKWIYGDPTKFWFTFPSLRAKALSTNGVGLVPIGQHSLSLTPDGQLLMFNNGYASLNQPAGETNGSSRLYSAVTGFFIDPAARTATPGLTFDDNRSAHSIICSSAYLSPDGSMLIQYSQENDGNVLRMKGLNPQKLTVFDFSYPTKFGCISSWNATIVPLDDLRLTY